VSSHLSPSPSRTGPGLELAAEICSARLTGATTGSVTVDFIPGRINLPGNYQADSITAGSTTLLLQVALPILLFSPSPVSPSVLTLLGGTNASLAPQIDYTQHVFLPFMKRHFGLDGVQLDIQKRGYFPRGGGEVRVAVTPFYAQGAEGSSSGKKLKGMRLLERGRVKLVGGVAHFAGLPTKVGREMVMGAKRALGDLKVLNSVDEDGEVPITIEYQREKNGVTKGAGSGIVLWAELEGGGYIGGSAVGQRGLDPATVGEAAAQELLRGLSAGGCVDEVWLHLRSRVFSPTSIFSGCKTKLSFSWPWLRVSRC